MADIMSEFSPLSDPVFVLTWQVHLAVVSLFALLAVWAGMTRQAWYIAPTLFCGLLWLFIPLEAPEPALVLLLAIPCLAVACRLVRPWIETPHSASRHALASGVSPRRGWNFRLADLLWLTLMVGMVTSLVMQIQRLDWSDSGTTDWPKLPVSGLLFCVVGVAVLSASRQPTFKRRSLAMLLVLILVLAAAGLHLTLPRQDWLLISSWSNIVADVNGITMLSDKPTQSDIFLLYVLSFMEYVVVLGMRLELTRHPSIADRSRLRTALRSVAMGCLSMLVVGLGVVYVAILTRPGWPEEQWPEKNEREAFLSVLNRQEEVNPHRSSLLEGSEVPAMPQAVVELFNELHELLQRDRISLFDSRNDKADLATEIRSADLARKMGYALTRQAKEDWAAGRRDDAIRHNLLTLQFAQAIQKRSTTMEAAAGINQDVVTLGHFSRVRQELSCAEIQRIMPALIERTIARKTPEHLLAHETVFMEEAGGWRVRLSGAIRRLLGKNHPYQKSITLLLKQRDAMLSLLITDFAIRCYYETYGQWPSDLQALVPNQLASVPLDPFSGESLIYRVVDDGFVLYSVGEDGHDSSGRFGSLWGKKDAYDLDLDAWHYEED